MNKAHRSVRLWGLAARTSNELAEILSVRDYEEVRNPGTYSPYLEGTIAYKSNASSDSIVHTLMTGVAIRLSTLCHEGYARALIENYPLLSPDLIDYGSSIVISVESETHCTGANWH